MILNIKLQRKMGIIYKRTENEKNHKKIININPQNRFIFPCSALIIHLNNNI